MEQEAWRASDPDALLIYNDYNGHKPGKRGKLIELLTELKHRGAPVDAYGMQGTSSWATIRFRSFGRLSTHCGSWAGALKRIFEEILGPPAKADHAPPPTGDPGAASPGG